VDRAEAARLAPDRLWRNGDFLRLWLGQTVSTLGVGMSRLAMPLLVLALTDSPALAGLVATAQSLPYLVLGLPAGALIDRWNRRTIMIACDVARALAVGAVPALWALGLLAAPHLLVVAVVQGIANTFFNLAQVASLPRVVPKAQIASAQALNTASEGIASLTSPGLAGVVIGLGRTTAAGAVVAYGLDALAHLVSAALLATIRTPFQGQRTAVPLRALGAAILEGVRYVLASPPLRLLAVFNMAHRLFLSPVYLTVVVLARDTLQLDAPGIGLLIGAGGVGGLLAAAVTPRLRTRLPVGWLMLGLIVANALGLALIGLATGPWLALVGMLINGMMETTTSITQVSYRLSIIPDRLQGRVNSVYRLGSFTAMSLGTAVGGLLIAAAGPRATIWALAAGMGLVALAGSLAGLARLRD
jgi:MFS family permease